MIKLHHIFKSFEGKEVIKDLEAELPESGFIALCGASGCGKTTLLNLISGLIKPDRGSIEINKNAVISMSFQEPRLLGERTAAQNVNLVLGDKKTTLPLAEELLSELGITDFNALPDELSGGMKARVGIARALAKKADIFLFDEPFAALDADTAQLTASVIKKHTEEKLVIAVIHDEAFAERIAERVIKLDMVS